MATKIISINKQSGLQQNAIRVNSIADIPLFLKDTIHIEGNSIIFECVEGMEKAPIGSVIGYEKSTITSTGWNAWYIDHCFTEPT